MPELSYSAVIKAAKSNDLSNIYYIYGDDVMSVEALTAKLISVFVKKGEEDCSLSRFSGELSDTESFFETLERLPFFTKYNCVLVNDLNADALAAGVFPELSKKLAALPETTVLIISITGFDVRFGKKAPVKNNKKLMELAAKNGVLCECAKRTASEIADAAIKKCAALGCVMDRKTALTLCELCGGDAMLVRNECEKLCAFCDGKDIAHDALKLLVPKQLSADSFAVAKAIGSLDSALAFRLLNDVFDLRADEVAVNAALSYAFVDLYRAKIAALCGKTPEDAAADFNMQGRAFVFRNHLRDSRTMSAAHLRRCLEILCRTDAELKSVSVNKRVLVERAVTEMLMVRE